MDDFNIMETFDAGALDSIARWAGSSIPVPATVAVGLSEYDEAGFLVDPVIVKFVNNASPLSPHVSKELEDAITGASEQYTVQDQDYDTESYPVLSLSIENVDDCFGVIFIAIHVDDSHFVYTRSQDETLLGEIKDRVDSIAREYAAEYPKDTPEIWHTFGILMDRDFVYDEDE